jgi:hypothetical protein
MGRKCTLGLDHIRVPLPPKNKFKDPAEQNLSVRSLTFQKNFQRVFGFFHLRALFIGIFKTYTIPSSFPGFNDGRVLGTTSRRSGSA